MSELDAKRQYYAEELRAVANLQSEALVRAFAELDPAGRMPFGRWGEPDDAARLVAWLCRDEGRWITGQVLDSEGGFRRSM